MARTPYTNFHDLNLNWIIEKIKTVFTPDNPPPYPVTSVNQKTGAVELKGTDIPVSANDPQTITNALASKYVKPASGIPASDLAPGVIPDPAIVIDDNAGSQVYDKTWSAHKLFQQEADILDLQNDKQDAPASAGTAGQVLGLNSSLQPEWVDMPEAQMIEAVDDWLSENITNPSNPPLDRSLSLANACAPADMVGRLNNKIKPLGVSETFTIDAFGSPTSYTIYGDFKSGDIFRISCAFTKEGTGSYNCAVKDINNNNVKVFYSNETADVTLTNDTSILTFVLGYASTITALNADISVISKLFLQVKENEDNIESNTDSIENLENQLIESVSIESQVESGYWAFADGRPGSSVNYVRTIDYVPNKCRKISINQSEGIYICLLAFNNDSYVGTYNHVTKTFDVISSLTHNYGDYSYNLDEIKEQYPNYKYKLDFREVSVTGPLNPSYVGEHTFYGFTASANHVFTIEKDGSGDFNTLLSGIRFATLFWDSIVYVGDGVWDLVEEYGSQLANISSTNWGLYLSNRIHIIFSANSKVTFNYTGNNTNVLIYFSPFNTGKHGFTLENLTLEASRCRYCVHDEQGEETEYYESNYINCNMLMDNSQNESWTPAQCIGGGLGRSGYINIQGCVFDSNMWGGIVTYHNCAYANSKSNINMHNSYFKRHGTFRLSWYGVSTEISTAYISGCSFANAIVHRAETESSVTENTAIVEWNNIVRG